jgi:hypothetical protein
MDYSKRGFASSQGKVCRFQMFALIPIERKDPTEFHRPFGIGSFAADRVKIVHSSWSVVPYAALIAVALVMTGAPWIGWQKRFSLRTLLIAMTLAAVAIGLAPLFTRLLTAPSANIHDFEVDPN